MAKSGTALRRAPMDVYTPAMRQAPPSSRSSRPGLFERLRLAFALPWAVIVAGCGQKGPLYHPPEPDVEPGEERGDEKGEEKEDDKTSVAPPAPGSRLA